ncbi:MAG: Rne/Rng family ribonuclease [Bacillota bacterium]|nr:Rne/Rng family ribonuclease [Bacillota bacterium]
MTKEMLVRFDGADTVIAYIEDGQLAEISLPRADNQYLLGNIYLGEVENVLPGMQAAFVDIGLEKNSFLYVDDAVTAAPPGSAAEEGKGERSITELVKPRQQVIVQVFKEPAGTKGARVTLQPSLAGRFVVLLPCGDYIAVSRRIEDEQQREQLKELVRETLPANMGAIVRTVAAEADGAQLAAELKALLKKWRRIQGSALKAQPPSLLYQDFDQLKRAIRDGNPQDLDAIVVEDEQAYARVAETIAEIAPALGDKLRLRESRNLLADYNIEEQLERALKRKVWLKHGGYIIFDQMEALTVIDVNTGKYVGERNLQDTVFKTNMEAMTEIARQLRLRNIGGIIVVDFIDMEDEQDKQKLLAAFEEELKKDRIRAAILGMTQLGLVEMTRKKIGHDLSAIIESECPHCGGKGRVLSERYSRLAQNNS